MAAYFGTATIVNERQIKVTTYGLTIGESYEIRLTFTDGKTRINRINNAEATSNTGWVSVDTTHTTDDVVKLDLVWNGMVLATKYIKKPSAPSSISYSSSINSYNSTKITWSSVSEATSYVLERATNGGSFSQVYSGTSTSYTDYGLNSSTTKVQYRVKAVNSGGSSSYKTGSVATDRKSVV